MHRISGMMSAIVPRCAPLLGRSCRLGDLRLRLRLRLQLRLRLGREIATSSTTPLSLPLLPFSSLEITQSPSEPISGLLCMTHTTRLYQLTSHLHPRAFSTKTSLHQLNNMPATRQSDSSLASRGKDASAPGNKPVAKSHRASATDCTQHWEDEEHLAQNQKDFAEFRADARKNSSASAGSSASGGSDSASGSGKGDHGEVPSGMKRGRGANQAGSQSKKAKSEERDPAGLPKGDKTRVPVVGQHVHWKAGKGYAKGEVVEVLYEEKEVEGKKAEASREDPRLVLKTDSSGRLAVHKPEDVYFD